MSTLPTPIHTTSNFTIPDDVTLEAAAAQYGYEGRRVEVEGDDGGVLEGVDGEALAFLSRTVTVLEATVAPTRKANDKWFQCPVTLDWLPVGEGVRYRGRLYSPQAAADLALERRSSKTTSEGPAHWSDDGSVRK